MDRKFLQGMVIVLLLVLAALLLSSRSDAANPPPTKLFIKSLKVNEVVGSELNSGPIFWPGIYGRPGKGRTIAIAAHRTTYTRPFYALNKLKRGQIIKLTYKGKVYRYKVRKTIVHPASNLHIADDIGIERLLLSACARADGTPTSLSYRIVVYALPVAVQRYLR